MQCRRLASLLMTPHQCFLLPAVMTVAAACQRTPHLMPPAPLPPAQPPRPEVVLPPVADDLRPAKNLLKKEARRLR